MDKYGFFLHKLRRIATGGVEPTTVTKEHHGCTLYMISGYSHRGNEKRLYFRQLTPSLSSVVYLWMAVLLKPIKVNMSAIFVGFQYTETPPGESEPHPRRPSATRRLQKHELRPSPRRQLHTQETAINTPVNVGTMDTRFLGSRLLSANVLVAAVASQAINVLFANISPWRPPCCRQSWLLTSLPANVGLACMLEEITA